MTNAERQKRYRDKKRGGPAVGRWGGHTSMAKVAKGVGATRTTMFMLMWIDQHAKDVMLNLDSGELKVTPTYKRLRAEYEAGVVAAVSSTKDRRGVKLVCARKDGKFVFTWVKADSDE